MEWRLAIIFITVIFISGCTTSSNQDKETVLCDNLTDSNEVNECLFEYARATGEPGHCSIISELYDIEEGASEIDCIIAAAGAVQNSSICDLFEPDVMLVVGEESVNAREYCIIMATS